jgi:hypothetical protein
MQRRAGEDWRAGGWMGAVAFPTVSADDPYAGLGVVGAMTDIKKYTAAGSTVLCLRILSRQV